MLVDLFIIPIKDHILNEHLLYNLMKLASKLKFFSMKIYNFYTDLNTAPLHFLINISWNDHFGNYLEDLNDLEDHVALVEKTITVIGLETEPYNMLMEDGSSR